MRWTNWRILLKPGVDFEPDLDYEGPACYELGVGGARGGGIRPYYVGETCNERARMNQYARDGSHNNGPIGEVLRAGKCLYYRACAMSSKQEAKSMQDRMLRKYKYEWNVHGNLGD